MSLFGFIGKVVGAGLNVATGGLSSAILSAGSAILGGQKARTVSSTFAGSGSGFGVPGVGTPFRLPDSTRVSGVSVGGMTIGSKTSYYGPTTGGRYLPHTTKSGKPRKVKKNGQYYKRPSMNTANPRALKRAIRRVVGFQHLARECGFSRPPHAMKGVHHTTKKRAAKCR